MTEEALSLREIQLAGLALLKQFDAFCRRHELRYSLCAGTLLGAVREGGFIPWDDDVDVFMPRKDFEKLQSLLDAGEDAFPDGTLYLNGLREGLSFAHGKLCDTNLRAPTPYLDEPGADYLGIDVFPVDGLPAGLGAQKRHYRRVNALRFLLALTAARRGSGKTRFKALFKGVLRTLARAFGAQRLSARIDAVCRRHEMETSPLAAPVSSSIDGLNETVPPDDFEGLIQLRFEDVLLPAIPDYDRYLTDMYGDYRQPPPPGERKSHFTRVVRVRADI